MEEERDMRWKVLGSEYLFREAWLTVRRDNVELPNGSHIPEYYVLEYPDWVCTLAITKDKKFVLVRQYRHGLQYTGYELCAGVSEKEDASPMESAKRELWEETGYGNGQWEQFMVSSANPGTHTNCTYCYLATDVELVSTQHLESTEDITVHLFTLDEIKEMLMHDKIKQALHVAPLWKYIALYAR